MKIRLDKYLADMGCGTRNEVKQAVKKGAVSVNDVPVKRPEEKVDTEADRIVFQGKTVSYLKYEYFMLNKPAGVVSATEDRRDRSH